MVDTDELAALATDLESFRVERKASFKGVKSDVEEAICAFANDLPGKGLPGYVLLGVSDRTGEPTGLPITDALLREITDIRSSGNILPFPVMSVGKATRPTPARPAFSARASRSRFSSVLRIVSSRESSGSSRIASSSCSVAVAAIAGRCRVTRVSQVAFVN